MTLLGIADARLLLSMVGSDEVLVRSRWSGCFAASRVFKLRRRRMMKIETIIMSVVAADAESSWKAMMIVLKPIPKKADH